MSEGLSNREIQKKQIGTPDGVPPPGYVWEYYKSDGKLYRKDSNGNEEEVNINVTINLTNTEGSELFPGDVVVIDVNVNNSCVLGSSNKDLKVAGVIFIGGNDGEIVQVCTSGIIDTKVNGNISRGDSLSTSVSTGRASSFAGAVNAVLGKALEQNGAGDGFIPVLVNLA